MSLPQIASDQPNPVGADPGLAPTQPPRPRWGRGRADAWVWVVASVVLLVGSGVVRAVQSSRHEVDKGYLVDCPFPLAKIPQSVDGWRVLAGSETVLDPLTTRITGSTDHILRTYVDEMTGVMLSVLILFGPAEPVLPHTPQICYPSSGFSSVAGPVDRDVKLGDNEVAKLRTSTFLKAGGRVPIRQTVYHSFLFDGQWSPMSGTRKFPRKNPGIFKVQIQRRVIDGEKQDDNEPIEDFLKKLLPVIETMIADSTRSPTTPPTTITAKTTTTAATSNSPEQPAR